ncbi:MAG: SEC-C domain-containing protein, partial [Alphaproteobacteria bacterium]|nr:SEC-C domain-containing protein [Alphaproteobacteria bacterium]
RWVNKALAKAQQKVEARNYDIRKQLLKFDDVMNDQRKVIYEQRREIMSARDVAAMVADMRIETIGEMVARAIPENAITEQWDVEGLHAECLRLLALDLPVADWAKEEGIGNDEIEARITAQSDRKMAEKTANYGAEIMRMAEKSLLLQLLDQTWKDHLLSLDHLRQGINLRAYAQRDPLNEYKREAFDLFEGMLGSLRQQVTSVLSHVELRVERPPIEEMAAEQEEALAPAMAEEGRATGTSGRPVQSRARPQRRAGPPPGVNGSAQPRVAQPRVIERPAGDRAPWAGTGRNAPCPCGSGRKFKHCHGRV